MNSPSSSVRASARASFIAFAGFGMFWGTWGAALPSLRESAGLTDAQLGIALLCVGAGALPAMALTGRAVDRFGVRATGAPLIALALGGVLLSWLARDLTSLALGMLFIGAASGASDVSANALAGLAEKRSGRRIITLAHAVFSSFVVVGSVSAGLLRAAVDAVVPLFVLSGAVVSIAGTAVLILGDGPQGSRAPKVGTRPSVGLRLLPFIAVGLVGALGFAAENAHQSWSAIFFTDELQATPFLASIAPATFAGVAAITRFSVGASLRIPDRILLIGGALVAVTGTTLLALAQTLPLALAGLGIAAAGTSVLFPTLLSRSMIGVPDQYRGRATSAVGTAAYLGFVLGPAYVGILSGAVGLRGAMLGVAALAFAFASLAPLAARARRSIPLDSATPVDSASPPDSASPDSAPSVQSKT